jgi:hypothetical protein
MDEKTLLDLPKETLVKLIQVYSRNWITVDGLWFTNVEDRFGTDVAVELDLKMWKVQAAIEAKRLLQIFGPGEKSLRDVLNIIDALTFSNIFTFEVENMDSEKAVVCYSHCPMQEARVKQGRREFPCKDVGIACYGTVAKVISPEIELKCIYCPPDKHPDDCWCKWEFYFSSPASN